MKAKIVVGMGYGDEGKGLTVNHLIKDSVNPIVIRFSGGQQAGHTVHVGDIKHTCSNFGAGVLMAVPTYFSEHTTFYPVTIVREKEVLRTKGIIDPKLILHPMAKITTPWDVYANRNCSDTLNDGTCGLGIGKTMHRNLQENLKLTAIDLMHLPTFYTKMGQIRLANKMVIMPDWFEEEMEEFWEAIENLSWIVSGYSCLKNYETVIFEGSQGVLLDMDHGSFPNVTYANTTSKNALEICHKLGIDEPKVYCVTRAYHTRHGNGYFHDDKLELKDTQHETNVTNKYQGNFKVSRLDYSLLDYAASIEMLYSKNCVHVLMVTCCNQVTLGDAFDIRKLESSWQDIQQSYSPYGDFIEIR